MIQKNEVYEIRINSITLQGYGVGRIDDKVIFVKGALPGEKIKAKVVLVKKNYLGGIVEEILEESSERTRPECPLFEKCGGCTMQNIDYKSQLKYKRKDIIDSLERIGGIKNPVVLETTGMEKPWRYRNKTQYPVQYSKGELNIGFYREKSHTVINVDKCPIQMNIASKARTLIKEFLKENKITIYNEKTHIGIVRNIIIRVSSKTGNVMICIVINGNTLPKCDALLLKLKEKLPEMISLYININKQKTNTVLGDSFKHIYGEKKLTDSIGDKNYLLSPGSFFQINPVQTEILYETIIEMADFDGNETVFDLFSGIGTIAAYIADKVQKVFAVESYGYAVEDAKENAKINNLNNIEFIQGKTEEKTAELMKLGIRPETVILDPPRKGCEKSLLDSIIEINPENIIYVSCNPSTLARDIKILTTENKYILQKVQPIDMFPQTGHVECVVRLCRQNS